MKLYFIHSFYHTHTSLCVYSIPFCFIYFIHSILFGPLMPLCFPILHEALFPEPPVFFAGFSENIHSASHVPWALLAAFPANAHMSSCFVVGFFFLVRNREGKARPVFHLISPRSFYDQPPSLEVSVRRQPRAFHHPLPWDRCFVTAERLGAVVGAGEIWGLQQPLNSFTKRMFLGHST